MSKKHFVALANALRESKPPKDGGPGDEPRLWQWNRDVNAIMDACKAMNSAFQASKFYDYVNSR